MKEKKFLYNGSNIYYKTIGQGKPVLLLHGFGEDGTVWERQVQALQNNYRLIIPDIPGSGKSELVANATIETYAEIIKELINIEHLQVNLTGADFELISLIGHSMGGYIALAFAEKYPQYLNSFGLFHSSAFADADEKKATRKKAIEFIQEKGAVAFLKTSIPGLFNEAFDAENKSVILSLINKASTFTQAALVQYYEAMITRSDRVHVLKNFPKPVLFIIGEHDKAVPLQSSLEQCYLPAISYVHILENAAHMGMYEETPKVNSVLKNFLAQV